MADELTYADLCLQARALLELQGALGLTGLDVPRAVPAAQPGAAVARPASAVSHNTEPAPPGASEDPRAAACRLVAAIDAGEPAILRRAAARPPRPRPADALAPALRAIREELGDCARCKLRDGRTNLVFGVGNPTARLMFIGEGPGRDEDLQGEPFVGAAGQLLDKMIVAMGLRRSDVYIANIVKCRPPKNRDPEPDEVATCQPFLRAQIRAVGPEVIVALGRIAAHNLLGIDTPITRLRGQWQELDGVAVMPTYHPAYLLRSPNEKKPAWDDLQAVMKRLGLQPPQRP